MPNRKKKYIVSGRRQIKRCQKFDISEQQPMDLQTYINVEIKAWNDKNNCVPFFPEFGSRQRIFEWNDKTPRNKSGTKTAWIATAAGGRSQQQ